MDNPRKTLCLSGPFKSFTATPLSRDHLFLSRNFNSVTNNPVHMGLFQNPTEKGRAVLNRSRKVPAVLNGGMRINYQGADPPRNGGCTKLLTGVIVLDWDAQLDICDSNVELLQDN